jgi:lon-related putative ATP-dependent protease
MAIEGLELPAAQLRVTCDPESLGFETTAQLGELTKTVGQERALAAMDLGLDIRIQGYNIFAVGPTGTGRMTAVLSRAREAAARQPTPSDWCYVYNFDDSRRPVALQLPPGTASALADEIEELVRACKQEVPRVFESDAYEHRKEEQIGDVQSKRDQVLRTLDQEARTEGLMIQATPMGIITVPLLNGKPMSREQFEALPEEEKDAFSKKMEAFRERIAEGLAQARQFEKEAKRLIDELDAEVAMMTIGHRFDDLKAKYQGETGVLSHLDRVAKDIVAHLDEFRQAEQQVEGEQREEMPSRYRVNVLVTNKDGGAPVIQEQSPTYYNLMGRLEYRPVSGGAVTDFTLIKPGAFHRANGGYLILRVLDVLLNPLAWEALKRTLRGRQAVIENIGEQFTPIPAATLIPQPIPLDLKVILVGSTYLYFLLYHLDEDFGRLFKVKADFDVDMAASAEANRQYAEYMAMHARQNHLRELRNDAAAAMVEFGMRMASDQEKLSTRFSTIADVLTEADYWAGREGSDVITAKHVQQAVEQREYRSRRIADRLFEFIRRGDLIVDVSGEVIGQVNGLAVMDMGDYAFGRPSRITARITPGRAGLINIEREARLGGDILHKAVMILTGYLAGTYATEAPLSLTASLSFEQSYDMVEGDSASCAELYTILSALADAPIEQGIAVTGSMDQSGNVQPIGGANQKIEGFYTTCKLKGLTGKQGVVIPRQNVKNLMLKPEVTEAVKAGQFHVWAVTSIAEGIEILTGVPAGSPQEPDTIHGRAAAKLRKFAEALAGVKDEKTTVVEVAPRTAAPAPPTPPPPPIPPQQPEEPGPDHPG